MELGLRVEQYIEWKTYFRQCIQSSSFTFQDESGFLKLSIGDESGTGSLLIKFQRKRSRSFYATTYLVKGTQTFFKSSVQFTKFDSDWCNIWECRNKKIRKHFAADDIMCFKVQLSDSEPPVDLAIADKSIQADFSVVQPELQHLSLDFCRLFESGVHSDVQVACDGGVIAAHRAVLSARSEVFANMFKSSPAGSRTDVVPVDIPDVNIATMSLFLKFFYSGKIPAITVEIALHLYSLAAKYAVPSLKKYSSDFMIKNLTEDNYISCLNLAIDNGDDYLKYAVIDYITSDGKLMKHQSLLDFSKVQENVAFEIYQTYVDKSCR